MERHGGSELPLEYDELFSPTKGGADSGNRLKVQNQMMNFISLHVVLCVETNVERFIKALVVLTGNIWARLGYLLNHGYTAERSCYGYESRRSFMNVNPVHR